MLRSAVLDSVGRPVSLAVPGPPPGPEIDGSVTGVLAGRVLVVAPVMRLVCGPFVVVGGLFRLVVVAGGLLFPLVVVCGGGGGSFVVAGGGGGSSCCASALAAKMEKTTRSDSSSDRLSEKRDCLISPAVSLRPFHATDAEKNNQRPRNG